MVWEGLSGDLGISYYLSPNIQTMFWARRARGGSDSSLSSPSVAAAALAAASGHFYAVTGARGGVKKNKYQKDA